MPKEIADCGFPEGIEAYFCTGNVNFAGKNYPPGLYFKGTFAIPFLGIRAEAEVQVGQLQIDINLSVTNNYVHGLYFDWQTHQDCFMLDCTWKRLTGDF